MPDTQMANGAASGEGQEGRSADLSDDVSRTIDNFRNCFFVENNKSNSSLANVSVPIATSALDTRKWNKMISRTLMDPTP